MQIELSPKEVKALLKLLEEHISYGWIKQEGEFEVNASWEVSPTLEKLYYHLKGTQERQEQIDRLIDRLDRALETARGW